MIIGLFSRFRNFTCRGHNLVDDELAWLFFHIFNYVQPRTRHLVRDLTRRTDISPCLTCFSCRTYAQRAH
jgi:hypothetical protein